MTRGGEFFRKFDIQLLATAAIADGNAGSNGVNMPLNKMSVYTVGGQETSFQVYLCSNDPLFKVGLFQRFLNGGDLVPILPDVLNGQANTIVGQALVDPEFGGKGRLDPDKQD